jgi:hypothetical protein
MYEITALDFACFTSSLIFFGDPVSPVRPRNEPLSLQGGSHCEANGLALLIHLQVLCVFSSGSISSSLTNHYTYTYY